MAKPLCCKPTVNSTCPITFRPSHHSVPTERYNTHTSENTSGVASLPPLLYVILTHTLGLPWLNNARPVCRWKQCEEEVEEVLMCVCAYACVRSCMHVCSSVQYVWVCVLICKCVCVCQQHSTTISSSGRDISTRALSRLSIVYIHFQLIQLLWI